jgi:REP element-mobilizing transposase RayT
MICDKFENKYRIPSTRLQTWDYGDNAAYFITICTKNRFHHFCEIIVETPDSAVLAKPTTKNMVLSEIGVMAEKYWWEIPNHFPFVKLDAFVVMPNHIHGIIMIDKRDNGHDVGNDVKMVKMVEIRHALSLQPVKPDPETWPVLAQQFIENALRSVDPVNLIHQFLQRDGELIRFG